MYTSVGVACSDNRVEWNSGDKCTYTSVGVACSDNRVEWNSGDKCMYTSVGVACSDNRVEWNSGDSVRIHQWVWHVVTTGWSGTVLTVYEYISGCGM